MHIVRIIVTVLVAILVLIFAGFGIFSNKASRTDKISWLIVDCILAFAMYFMWV